MASLNDTSWTPIYYDPWGWQYSYGGRQEVSRGEADKPSSPPVEPKADAQEERTGRQLSGLYGTGYSWNPWPGLLHANYNTYRQLLRIPSVAIVRKVVFDSIKSGSWTVEADEGVAEAAKTLIENSFVRRRTQILDHALKALDFGHAKFEVVNGIVDGNRAPVKFKPLSWRPTTIDYLEDTGEVIGLSQGDVHLRGGDWFLYTYGGDPGEYEGRSRLENVRESGSKWLEVQIKIGRLIDKEAGSIIVGTYPPGNGKAEDSTTASNRTLMSGVAQGASQGAAWLAVENALGALTPMQRASATVDQVTELLKQKVWGLEKVDLAGNGATLAAMQMYSAYLDTQMIRGYCRPERSIIEGQYGNKAEAGTHTDTGTSDSETTEADIVEALNCGPVDNTLEDYGGKALRGKVRIVAEPLRDVQEAVDMSVINNLTTGQLSGDIYRTFDIDAIFDRRGIQKRKTPLPAPEVVQPPPGQPGRNGAPINGNGNANGKPVNGKPGKRPIGMSRLEKELVKSVRINRLANSYQAGESMPNVAPPKKEKTVTVKRGANGDITAKILED